MLKNMGLWFLQERKQMCNEDYSTIRDMRQSIQDYERQVNTWMKASEKLSLDLFHTKNERDLYRQCLVQMLNAIKDEGAVPQYHRHVLRKHRSEWPVLWKAIDSAMTILENKDV
jgi:hypothetical protein